MRAALIDEDKNGILHLQTLLKQHCPLVKVAGTAHSAKEALLLLHSQPVDVVFLEVQLPEMSGFDLLRQLGNYCFKVVFVTQYEDAALEAIRIAAVDYLLKPVDAPQLVAAVQRVNRLLMLESWECFNGSDYPLLPLYQRFSLYDTGGLFRILSPGNIVYFESLNTSVKVFPAEAPHFVVSKPIHLLEKALETHGFIRVHKKYLVNRSYVWGYQTKDGIMELLLQGNFAVTVAREKKDRVKKQLITIDL
jgi:two-component system LytT family response regulator